MVIGFSQWQTHGSYLKSKKQWQLIPRGVSSAWDIFRRKKALVPWYKLMWFKKNIPRHSIVIWIAIKVRLQTKDKIIRYGLANGTACSLCKRPNESLNNLFFSCQITLRIWKKFLSWSNWKYNIMAWNDYVNYLAANWNSNGLKPTLKKLSLGATIYHIWLERNRRTIFNETMKIRCSIKLIKSIVRESVLSFKGELSERGSIYYPQLRVV